MHMFVYFILECSCNHKRWSVLGIAVQNVFYCLYVICLTTSVYICSHASDFTSIWSICQVCLHYSVEGIMLLPAFSLFGLYCAHIFISTTAFSSLVVFQTVNTVA